MLVRALRRKINRKRDRNVKAGGYIKVFSEVAARWDATLKKRSGGGRGVSCGDLWGKQGLGVFGEHRGPGMRALSGEQQGVGVREVG